MSHDRTITNEDRRQWIQNDEGLYNWFRSERQPMAKFIQSHKGEIDKCIRNVTGGFRRPHYLAYGR